MALCINRTEENMARLTNFIYCLNAERIAAPDGSGESMNARGVLPVITPEFVPGTFSFSIIFSIQGIDIGNSNTMQILFLKEDKALVDSGVITIPPMTNLKEDGLPMEYKGLNMSMDLRNVVFEKEGVYTTKIILNKEEIGDNPIYVKGKR